MSHVGRRTYFAIGLFVLLAFAMRALSLDVQPLWRDEVDALRFASSPWPELRASFTRTGWNGPFYHLLLRGWIALAGTSEYSLRFLSLWFGVLCVALIYALGHRLFDRAVGALAALLLATAPYMVWYGQEVKMYTLVPALALLAIYALRRGVEGAGWHWWAAQILATSFALYSHILAALLIPVQALLYLLWWPQVRKQWVGGLISLVCLTVPYVPLLVWQWPLIFQTRETGYYPYTMREIGEILLYAWSLGITTPSTLESGFLQAMMAGLALWGTGSVVAGSVSMRRWARHGSDRPAITRGGTGLRPTAYSLAPVVWLLVPYLALGIVSIWQPLFTDRYLIWCAPAFYLLVALGLASFLRFRGWGVWLIALAVGLLLVGNGVNVWREATIPIKSDFRSAAAFITDYGETSEIGGAQEPPRGQHPFRLYLPLAIGGDNDDALIVFQIPYGRYTFDYYLPERTYAWADGYYTNFRDASGDYEVTAEEHAAYMASITTGYEVVWLVLTEAEMWDERGLTRDWLETNARLVAEAHFMRVDVYRYRFPPPQ